jgi:hypothetical protein
MAELDGVMVAFGRAAAQWRHSYFNQMRDEQPDKISADRSHSQDIGAIPRDYSKARSTLLQSILHDKINQAVWHHYLLYDLLSIKKAGHTWISANHKNEIGA